jgi:hypothetical protein
MFSQYVYFFGLTLHSLLFALTLGHLSRWFPAFGHGLMLISIAGLVSFLFMALMVRNAEFNKFLCFGIFILGLGGILAWY